MKCIFYVKASFFRFAICFCLLLATVPCRFAPIADAQESEDARVATTQETPELSALELTRLAVDSDANTRYGMLNQISPRGVSQQDRAEIVRLLIDQLDNPSVVWIAFFITHHVPIDIELFGDGPATRLVSDE